MAEQVTARSVWALDVFRRAYRLSLEVHRSSLAWPKIEQYGGVADQVRRSSKAVCALLVEGAGRQPGSNTEFRRYVVMAIGSADESRLWCSYAADLDLVPRPTAMIWQDELSEIARMLQGLRNSLPD